MTDLHIMGGKSAIQLSEGAPSGWYDILGPGSPGLFLAPFSTSTTSWVWEFHFVLGGTFAYYVNGSLLNTTADYQSSHPSDAQIGFVDFPTVSDTRQDWTLTDFKVGTTRGASDLFDQPAVDSMGWFSAGPSPYWVRAPQVTGPYGGDPPSLWVAGLISNSYFYPSPDGATTDFGHMPTALTAVDDWWLTFTFTPADPTDMLAAMNDPTNLGFLGRFLNVISTPSIFGLSLIDTSIF